MGVGQASGLAPDAQKAQLSTRSIFQLLDRTPPIDADSEGGTHTEAMLLCGHIANFY
jgi:hypothetical protein